jgi:uncharacterized protein (TIGR02145 family)
MKSIKSILLLLCILLFVNSMNGQYFKKSKKNKTSIKTNDDQNKLKKSIKVGDQNWMAENLNTTIFRNGDLILQAQSDDAWQEAGFNKQPAWCYYNQRINDSVFEVKHLGILYNSYALNDPRGLAPEGWRIPSITDWKKLEGYLSLSEMSLIDAFSKEGWTNGNLGKNTTELNFYPAGWRDVGCGGLGSKISFWAFQSPINGYTPYVNLFFDEKNLGTLKNDSTSWIMGYNIRCIKD